MKHTIAVVGLGAAARRIHLPAYKRIPNLDVVAGCDPVARDGDFPFPLFASVDEMLDRVQPEILTVATPPDLHFKLARVGLEAGCHVFCEKPFMNSLSEADEIIALAKRVGRRVVVNNQFRFMSSHTAAKQKIGKPDFGDLLFVAIHQTFFTTPETEAGWRGKDPQRTAKEFGTHALDLCRYFFDEDPLSISTRMPRGKTQQGPDYLNLMQLEFSGDRVGCITLDRLSRGPHRYLDTRLDGEFACIETSLGGKLEASFGIRATTRRPFMALDAAMGGRARLYNGDKFSLLATDPLDLFAHATGRLMRAFLAALEADAVPPCSAADNYRTLALMFAAYESDAKRAPISMHYGSKSI